MSLGALFIVYLVGLVSPGPDTVLALSTTATHNRRAGLLTVLGFMVGVTTVMTLVLCLLTFFESSGVQLMLGIKVLGACYLGTLGLMAFIRPPRFSTTSHVSRRGTFFLQGLLCNITNPKGYIHYMVMVTTFGLCIQQGLYLVPIAVLICGLWFSGLVVGLSSYLNQKVERMRRYQWIMHYVAGFVFLSYAIVMVCTL